MKIFLTYVTLVRNIFHVYITIRLQHKRCFTIIIWGNICWNDSTSWGLPHIEVKFSWIRQDALRIWVSNSPYVFNDDGADIHVYCSNTRYINNAIRALLVSSLKTH